MRVNAADLTTCAIARVEGGPRCGKSAVTTMSGHEPEHFDGEGTLWPELELTFGVCTEHLETFTPAFLEGRAGLGMVHTGNGLQSRGLTHPDA